jgi:hypothetical protein
MANVEAVYALFLIARDNTEWHTGRMKLRTGRTASAPVYGFIFSAESRAG